MSSDDFQTKYASFMENMLKSAVAETTKLYETMVDELKAEISRIKKENEELKAKCRQFEDAGSLPAGHHAENPPLPGQSRDSEKCDTAVQCELVSFRTMLVEQSQPGERIGYCLQEHTYIAPEEGNSQMTFVLVKQEEPYNHTALHSAFKQEEVESAVVSEQALNNNSDSLHTSLKGTENEGTLINQECSTEETTLAQDDGETRVVLEAPCLGTSSHSDGAQSQTSDPAHSIVISLAAIQDSIKEEYEVRQEISEIEAQVPQQCQRDGETLANGQTVTVQPHAEEQLTQSLLVNKEVACEKVKNSLAEDDATSKTNLPVRRRRGRPPKNLKQKEMLGSSSVDVLGGLKKLNTHSVRRETVDAIDRVNSSSPMASQASPIQPKETFIITPSVQENQMANIAVEDMENREVVSLPASALSLSSSCSSEEPKNPETQKLPMEVEEEATHSPSTKVSSGNETVNNPTLESSQATTGQHKERRTSVTLQDAMLLVEAMNQSTTENLFSSSLRASRPQIRCPSCVGTLQAVKTIPVKLQTPPFKSQFTVKNNETHIAFVIPKHQHVSSNAATQTIAQPSPHLLTPIKLNIERAQSIVVPRVGSSHIIAATPPTKVSMTESKATHNNGFLPTATATSSPLETPSLSSHPQKTDATSGNSLPVSQLTNPSADPKSVVGPRKKIIVVPRQVTVSSKLRLQTAALAAKLATTVPPEVPVAGTPAQLISTTQELSKASADALSQKRDNTADNLEHPKQTASVSETVSAPTETCSSVKQSASVFQATQPTVEKKLNAVVRLTKLPFFVSPEESVLVSRLLSKGFSEGTTQENPSKPAISETPLLSSDICLKLIETPVSLSTPQKSDESNIQKMTLSSETSSVLKEAPVSESVQLSATSVRPALNVDNSEVQKNDSPTIIQLTSVSKEVSDPHLQMTKTQFLAQLAVSPIVQEPEKKANSDLDTRTCEKKRSQKNFLVSRLRSHLKTHLQTRRTETKPEGNSEIETTTVSHEKLGLVNDTLNDENLTKEPSPVTLKKTDVVENNTALHSDRDSVDTEHKKSTSVSPRRSCSSEKTVTCKKTKSSSVSPRRFSVGTDGVGSKSKKSCSVSPRRSSSSKETDSPEETKSTSVSPRRSSLGTDGVSSKNKKSSSVSPRRSTSGREDMDSHNKNSSSLRPRSPSRTKERASPKITKNGTSPRNTNANSVSPLQSTKEGARTKQIKSPSVSPTASNSSQSGTRKSSGFTKGDSRSKRIKKEPSSFSITADGTVTKRNNSETGSPSVKSLGIVKNSINPKSAGDLTPAKKPRLIQDVIGLKKGFQVVKTMKLAKAAKVKRMAKMRECNKSKLQTSRLSESQTNCEVKKCRAKLWMPPVMTEIEINKAREKDSSLLPVKTETGSNDQNLGYSPSVLPSFVPSPIVSPLQPLSVIGRHLLRNQCGECGRILSSSAALQSHVSLHTGHRPFSCTFCGKSFPDSKSFKRHGRVHRNGRIHICQHCGKGFVYRFGLTKHIQMVHGRLKPFICHICNKGFFTKRDVEVHIRIHTGEKPFQCTLCERRFTRRVELNMHLRWHNGEKRHWCPYCGKGFLDYNNLKRHKYTHTGEKPYTCPHCPKKFTQTGHLKKHVKNVHSE